MVTITNVDAKYFTLDGITYPKIYQPLISGTRGIGIYSIFDTKLQIVSSTDYTEYTVNGSTFASQSLAVAAILDVVYAPEGLTSSDHATLSNLLWSNSGHTGAATPIDAANKYAGWDALGNPIAKENSGGWYVPTSVSITGTAVTLDCQNNQSAKFEILGDPADVVSDNIDLTFSNITGTKFINFSFNLDTGGNPFLIAFNSGHIKLMKAPNWCGVDYSTIDELYLADNYTGLVNIHMEWCDEQSLWLVNIYIEDKLPTNILAYSASISYNCQLSDHQSTTFTGDSDLTLINKIPGIYIYKGIISGSGVTDITLDSTFGTAYSNNDEIPYTSGSKFLITIEIDENLDTCHTITSFPV